MFIAKLKKEKRDSNECNHSMQPALLCLFSATSSSCQPANRRISKEIIEHRPAALRLLLLRRLITTPQNPVAIDIP